jgi:hypothetical protein
MTSIKKVPDDISLETPFEDQAPLQRFLDQSLSQNNSDGIEELLWLFIKVVEQIAKKDEVQGIKLGYERAVLIDNESGEYRIESRFASNKKWSSQFDLDILNEGFLFLLDTFEYPKKQEEPKEKINSNSSTFKLSFPNESLSKRIIDEFLRRCPLIDECLEFHFYVLMGKADIKIISSGDPIPYDVVTFNLLERLRPRENFSGVSFKINVATNATTECPLCNGRTGVRGRADALSPCKTC